MAMVVVTIVKLTIITMVTIITIVLMTIVSANKFLGFVSLPIWIAAEAEFQKEVSSLEKTNWGFGVSKKATQVFQHNLRTKQNQNQHPQNRIFPHRFYSSQKGCYPSNSGGEEFLLIDAQDTKIYQVKVKVIKPRKLNSGMCVSTVWRHQHQ